MQGQKLLPTVLIEGEHGTWEALKEIITLRLLPQLDSKGIVIFKPHLSPLSPSIQMVPFHDIWSRTKPYPERFPQLAYVIAGEGEMILGNKWVYLTSGQGIFVPAGIPQAPHAMHDRNIRFSDWLRILVYPFGVIVHRCRLTPKVHEKSIRFFIPNLALNELFTAWVQGFQSQSDNHLRNKSLLCAFLLLIAESTPVPINPIENLPANFSELPAPLQKALLAIHSGFNQPFNLKVLAERCFISPYHLCHLFRQHLKVTPLGYLTRLRMTIAKQLLEDAGLSVGDVAVLVGYQDWRHFHRLFVRQFGLSPSTVRSKRKSLPHRIFKPLL